jgi:enterobactin synthetase component D
VPAPLAPQQLALDLGCSVKTAGFVVRDYEAIIAELSSLAGYGMPAAAVAKRRAEFLAGRFAAQQALGALGVDATPGRNEDGTPCWPALVSGSITHGAARALCAVARSAEMRSLGIDAERLMGEGAKDELRARICDREERALLAESIALPEHHLITIAFSAKESLYKCLYPLVGHYMDFSAARLVEAVAQPRDSGTAGELMLELSVDWSKDFRRGARLHARFFASAEHVESAVLLPA